MSDPGAAIARLEVQVMHLIEGMNDLKRDNADAQAELRGIRATLDQSKGGITVLRWLGFGSLAGALAAAAAFYAWVKGL